MAASICGHANLIEVKRDHVTGAVLVYEETKEGMDEGFHGDRIRSAEGFFDSRCDPTFWGAANESVDILPGHDGKPGPKSP